MYMSRNPFSTMLTATMAAAGLTVGFTGMCLMIVVNITEPKTATVSDLSGAVVGSLVGFTMLFCGLNMLFCNQQPVGAAALFSPQGREEAGAPPANALLPHR